jgi:AraC-like DNA-binding protein
MASHLHISVSQLSHRYREHTGVSPMAAVAQRRIEHAKLLLMKGMPLKTISQQLGFSDAFHLSKAFKKALGMAPRHFLKSNP